MMNPALIIWPGGEHPMRLRLAELEGLQSKLDAGPEFLLNRLRLGQWRASDLFEVVRWGLIGGGMAHTDADKLVKRVFDQHPVGHFKITAMHVLALALYGPLDDVVGEDMPVVEPTLDHQKTENGNLVSITD